MTPDVSVLMPAFNAESTLGQQLEALSRQDVPFEWELLVCDNGSTDATARVASEWQGRLPLTVVDASSRRGPAAARNRGAQLASAPLLLFCDADDVVADDWMLELHRALQGADLVAGGRRYARLNAQPHGPADWEQPLFTKPAPLLPLPAATTSNLGVRAVVFSAVGGFDESLRAAEDIDFCWRVQLAGYRLIAQPNAVVHIRRRSTLPAVFRQAFGYGVGDRVLLRKFAGEASGAQPAAAIEAQPEAQPQQEAQSSIEVQPRPGRVRRMLGRRSIDLRYLADRLGRRLGRTFGGWST